MQLAVKAVTAAAPAIVDTVKANAPSVYARAKKYFTQQGNDIHVAATSASKSSDSRMGLAVVEAMIDPRRSANDQIALLSAVASAAPSVSQEQMTSLIAGIQKLKSQAFANAVEHHEKLSGVSEIVMAEQIRLINATTSALGCTSDQLSDLLTTFANIGPEDIRTVRAFGALAGVRVLKN